MQDDYESPSVDLDEPRHWRLARQSMWLLMVAIAGMAWVFAKVTFLYKAAESGTWTSLGELRSAACGSTVALGVSACLAVSTACALVAAVRCPGRVRWAGLAFLAASGLPLLAWAALVLDMVRGQP